jgi:proteasome activator-like protein
MMTEIRNNAEIPNMEDVMSEPDANAAPAHDAAPNEVERGELVERGVLDAGAVEIVDIEASESVTEPGKVMRIGSMVKQLLEEVRLAPLDEASRERLAEIYERSIVEVSGALSPDLQDELHSLALPFRPDVVPSEAEIRVAKAQLVGWLEGLFHGIQATLFAQQIAARQQFEQLRQLPGATGGPGQRPGQGDRPGTYL